MSLGFREDQKRRRRRMRWTLFKWTVALCLIAAAGVWAYREGSRLARSEVGDLEGEIASLRSGLADLERQNAEQRLAIEAQRAEAERWRQRYEREVPTGERKELVDLVHARLAAGVSLERLRFVIDAAQDKDDCIADPVTKRFLVRTPLYSGPDDTVRFAGGALLVTGHGVSARDSLGNPEAWFNPAEPVTVRLGHISGKTSEVAGQLPLQHSMVVDDREHRFNFTRGARGFVEVTSQECRYP